MLESHRGGFVPCLDDDGDGVGVLIAFQCSVEPVSELEAECVLAGLKFESGGSLALAVVQVLFVCRNDLASGSEIGIDEDVEVSCALVDFA